MDTLRWSRLSVVIRVARVKGVFAARYATFQALTLTQQTLDTVTTATANVRDRYSQGSAAQAQ